MNKQKWIFFAVVLLMMGSTAAVLAHLKANQKLGRPGVTTRPLADSKNVEVLLPERVLDFTSQVMTQQEVVVATLPKDTSYGQRIYHAPDGFTTQVNVVLMGSDRTSIHKPEFCLEGAGWKIDQQASREETVQIEHPHAYDLPVNKFIATRQFKNNGQAETWRGVYVFWFVAGDAYTAQHWQRQWWMARELLQTGVLQRWAYISYFAVCMPGQEQETFERMKKMIAASVPEFQLVPDPKEQAAPAGQRPM